MRLLTAMTRTRDPVLAERMVAPGGASLSARSERIAEVPGLGENAVPADARRPIEAAVGSIRVNQKARAQALPDVSRWVIKC